jgi:hypothetical protein
VGCSRGLGIPAYQSLECAENSGVSKATLIAGYDLYARLDIIKKIKRQKTKKRSTDSKSGVQ